RGFLRNRSIQAEVVAVTPAEQRADREPRRLTEDVPARDVDARLDVGVPFQGGVHAAVQPGQLAWVLAEQVRAQLGEAGPHAGSVRGQVERTKRTDLAVPDQAGV